MATRRLIGGTRSTRTTDSWNLVSLAAASPQSPFDARAGLEELLALGDGLRAGAHRDIGVAEPHGLALAVLPCAPERTHGALDRERRRRRDRLGRPRRPLHQLTGRCDLG